MNGVTKMNDVYELICGKMLRVLDAEDQASADFLNKQHVFIVGSKGIPAQYGGFETYVEKMVEYQTDKNIQFHVARLADNEKRYEYNGAICFNVKVPDIGPAKAVYYDIAALEKCIKYCSKMNLHKPPIFYVLACRIGPFIGYLKKRIQKLGGVLLVNPDGHEWKRSKWSLPVRKYWKVSEELMVRSADLMVCDSKKIEDYIREDYWQYNHMVPEDAKVYFDTYLSYGCDSAPSTLPDDSEQFLGWLKEKGLSSGEYYLVVGRFVPENNVETIVREFMQSNTTKKLALITTENEKLYNEAMKYCQGRLCASTIDQIASAALYTVGHDYFAAVREEYKARRDALVAKLREIPGVVYSEPKGAFYVMAALPVDDADKFQKWLLEEFDDDGDTVMFAPGEPFYGTPNTGRNEIRMAYVLKKEDLERAMELLKKGIEAYNAR